MEKPVVSFIGMGYVGLTSAATFAKHGFKTICTTTTDEKADNLNWGISPFFEPLLDDLVAEVVGEGLLSGSTNNVDTVKISDITFLCVGTPSMPDGSPDLSQIENASKDIGMGLKHAEGYRLVVVKSTVPPGTTEEVVLPILERYSGKSVGDDYGLCMSPEFLREGEAVSDSLNPDRIVIGEYDTRSGDFLELVFQDYDCPKMRCSIKSAELIKYASNSLLATKISFANEFSRICEKFGVDVYEVMRGVGMDFRINPRFLNAGVGFGGSCFPKDVNAIVSYASRKGVETPILGSVLYTNELQPKHLFDLIKDKVGSLNGKVIAFLGLSFKPNTEDVRETRALPVIEMLFKEGAKINAYDPKAIDNFKVLTKLPISYYDDWRDALKGSDLLVVQSDWEEIKAIKVEDIKELLKSPIVVDGRRTWDPDELISKGIRYYGIGWRNY
jgi:UDPglucose 6-dehydrogenase